MKKYLEVGKIVGTHGLKGEVRIQPWADSCEFLLDFKRLYYNNGENCFNVTASRVQKNVVVAKLEGIDSIEQADTLRNKVLFIDRADAQLAEGQYFIQDLIGLRVIDADNGREYGVINDIFNTGANDIYSVRAENGKDYLIPAIDQVLAGTDLEAGTVAIHVIKGMFDDEN